MTDAEARSRAHLLTFRSMQGQLWLDEPTEVLRQLKLIAADHCQKSCLALGDKRTAKAMELVLGHQVKPTGKQARELGRLVKRTGK